MKTIILALLVISQVIPVFSQKLYVSAFSQRDSFVVVPEKIILKDNVTGKSFEVYGPLIDIPRVLSVDDNASGIHYQLIGSILEIDSDALINNYSMMDILGGNINPKNLSQSHNNLQIDLNNLTNGTYFVLVSTEKEFKVIKFINMNSTFQVICNESKLNNERLVTICFYNKAFYPDSMIVDVNSQNKVKFELKRKIPQKIDKIKASFKVKNARRSNQLTENNVSSTKYDTVSFSSEFTLDKLNNDNCFDLYDEVVIENKFINFYFGFNTNPDSMSAFINYEQKNPMDIQNRFCFNTGLHYIDVNKLSGIIQGEELKNNLVFNQINKMIETESKQRVINVFEAVNYEDAYAEIEIVPCWE